MRRHWVLVAFAVLVVTACMSGFQIGVVQAKSWGYTSGDFSGTYGLQGNGSVSFPIPPFSALNGPYALVGRIAADGQGNISTRIIESYNGNIVPAAGTGTYVVKPDGTIVMVNSFAGPNSQKITIEMTGVLFDVGNQAVLTTSKIIEPALAAGLPGFTGFTATAMLIKQGKNYGWANADWSGSFANVDRGTIALPSEHPLANLNGPLSGLGRTTVDGQGNFTGTIITTVGGFNILESDTGQYQVSPDGWVKLTVQGSSLTLIFDGVLVDAGNKVLLLLTGLPGLGLPEGYIGTTWTEVDSRQ